jgi:hypothetical protein
MFKMKKKQYLIKQENKGQSLVELAIFLPIIFMLLSGLIEFGFLLNQYINMMDGPREAARFATDIAPYKKSGTSTIDDPEFYTALEKIAESSIRPYNLDLAMDDVVISVFSIKNGAVFARYPQDIATVAPSKAGEWHLTGNHDSNFTIGMIQDRLDITAPNSGMVLVELFYNYHQTLALPWLTVWLPDPILLSSYAIAPVPAAEPK